MQQLTQKLGSGETAVVELPLPVVSAGMVLVRNHYSLISAGTEGSFVRAARLSLLGKAREKPEQVRQVLDALRRYGPRQTYRAVVNKLDAYTPLGYSCAGEVLAVGAGVTEFAAGDRVACGGAGYANHAEVVCVPVNLTVKLPAGADLKLACYNTLGAIALQGVRQADLRLGETAAVIGLGLLGQLTGLLLRASGVRVVGVDLDARAVDTARQHAADHAWLRSEPGLAERVRQLTGGLGADAVIIAAAASSEDPINFAGELARQKGRVVVVGAVPTGFERETYYRKELDVRMSCSYGPGRYDPAYEEKGLDYPAAYVRWTEKRNMQAFQELVHAKRADIGYLTTHEFPLEEAPRAYDLILARSEPCLGIVLRYDVGRPLAAGAVRLREARAAGAVRLAFIGAGQYAQSNLLPNLPGGGEVTRRAVLTASGATSRRVAEKFGFELSTADENDILGDASINTVFIATRHDTHAAYAARAIAAGKHVFVEKPLCLTPEELATVRAAREARGDTQFMVGFNRRFSPLARLLKERIGAGPLSMLYRVNAGAIPADHWTQDPQRGGGRIVGEACHFVDFLTFLCGALPVRVHAAALPDARNLQDTVAVTLAFADGSVGTLAYYANGARALEKEYVEVYRAGATGLLRDFRSVEILAGRRVASRRLALQDKGQAVMLREFVDRVRAGGPPLIPEAELYAVTQATFAILESLRTREAVDVAGGASACDPVHVTSSRGAMAAS